MRSFLLLASSEDSRNGLSLRSSKIRLDPFSNEQLHMINEISVEDWRLKPQTGPGQNVGPEHRLRYSVQLAHQMIVQPVRRPAVRDPARERRALGLHAGPRQDL